MFYDLLTVGNEYNVKNIYICLGPRNKFIKMT